MKYLSNELNRTRLATLVATHLVASHTIGRVDQDDKQGGGDVVVGGDFAGQSDQQVDIQIFDTAGAAGVSAPVLTGQGNGTLDALAIDGAPDPQTVRLTLVNAGTTTTAASIPFQGVTIRARSSGDGGNDITIAIDRSAITLGATSFSLVSDLQVGGDGNIGNQWDWGNKLQNPNTLDIPDDAPRVALGFDVQVYRAYKTYDGTQYTYKLTPDVVRPVPAGSKVWAVSGGYVITITNGVTTETFGISTPIVSLYDALVAMNSSSLVFVDGVIVQDMKPNGMAIDDLSVFTGSYLQSQTASGGQDIQTAAIGLTIADGAPTERLTITCLSNAVFNAETWSVVGDIGGNYGTAVTGVLFSVAGCPYTFTIPTVSGAGGTGTGGGGAHPGATFLAELVLVDRGDQVQTPTLCVEQPELGAAVHDGVWEFLYKKRPVGPCPCEDAPLDGGPSADCLGITDFGGGSAVEATDLQRLRAIWVDRWFGSMMQFLRQVGSATAYGGGGVGGALQPEVNALVTLPNNSALMTGARGIVVDALSKIFAQVTGSPFPSWAVAMPVVEGMLIQPSVRNGFVFRAGGAGTTHASVEPTWPTNLGYTVTDNGITWTAVSLDAIAAYDTAFANVKREIGNLALTSVKSWTTATDYPAGTFLAPATPNGNLYWNAGKSGTSGGSSPTFPTNGTSVTDGSDIIWQDLGKYWNANASVAQGQIILTPGGVFEATNNGQSHASDEPDWVGLYVTDNTVRWMRVGAAIDSAISPGQGGALNDGATGPPQVQSVTSTFSFAGAPGENPTLVNLTDFYALDPSGMTNGDYTGGTGMDLTPGLSTSNTYSQNYVGLNGQNFSVAAFLNNLKSVFAEAFAIAGVDATFSSASLNGDGCWRDAGDSAWFEYTGTDVPYLPIQPGHYYVTCRKALDDDGKVTEATTKEWGFGPKIGCVGQLKAGQDRLRITITGAGGGSSLGTGYQQGEAIVATIVHSALLQLVGGVTGTDSQLWSVGGSAHTFPDYTLNVVTPNTYDQDGLTFVIHPGIIPFVVGDHFDFAIESARFKYQINGGGYSAAIDVDVSAPVSIGSDGLTVTFTPGRAPSWVAGDTWSFLAEAVNGPDNLRTLKDGALTWDTNQALVITPDGTYGVTCVMLGEHQIPSTATITFQGSNDNFSTTPLSQVIPWTKRNIRYEFDTPQTYTKFRLQVSTAGSIEWLYVSDLPLELVVTQTGGSAKELGILTQKLRLPSVLVRQALNASVIHTCIDYQSYLDLGSLLEWAGENEQGRFGAIFTAEEAGCGIFTSGDPELEFTDEFDFQATDPDYRAVSITMPLQALP